MAWSDSDVQNVVSMMGREHSQRYAPLREVETYWQTLCGADAVPLRSQIDPRGIEGALEYAFLAERIAPQMAKLRVAGSHLNDLMGMEVAGMPLSTLFAPSDRDKLATAVGHLFADPAIVHIQIVAEGGFAKSALDGELLLMPLRSDMGDLSRAIGCLVTHGRICRTPRRFEINHVSTRPAIDLALRPAPKLDYSNLNKSSVVRHMSEQPRPFVAKSTVHQNKSNVPYLRVVVSNDDEI
jgi:hypothetical protein